MKVKDKNLSEKEIDDLVIAQANDENAWTDIRSVKNRAERGSREKFLQALSKVPKVEPDENDVYCKKFFTNPKYISLSNDAQIDKGIDSE